VVGRGSEPTPEAIRSIGCDPVLDGLSTAGEPDEEQYHGT
jgi:hypothetical protein